jgi:hypothetical protein
MTRDDAPAPVRGFYERAVDAAELADAREVEGLDEELSLMRTRLRELVRERPEEYELMLKGVALIVRTVAARYRMSPRRADEFGARVSAVVEDLGAQMWPVELLDRE